MVVELSERQNSGASFRIFDKNNYWTAPYMYDVKNNTRFIIDLHSMIDSDGNICNPKHLFIIGFWSMGGNPIKIKIYTHKE